MLPCLLLFSQNLKDNNYLSLCEANCTYKGYDTGTKKVICECSIKTKFIILSQILDNKNELLFKIIDEDIIPIPSSNFDIDSIISSKIEIIQSSILDSEFIVNGNSDIPSIVNIISDRETDTNINSDRETEMNINSDREKDININSDRKTDMNINSDGDTDTNINTNEGKDINMNTSGDSDTKYGVRGSEYTNPIDLPTTILTNLQTDDIYTKYLKYLNSEDLRI